MQTRTKKRPQPPTRKRIPEKAPVNAASLLFLASRWLSLAVALATLLTAIHEKGGPSLHALLRLLDHLAAPR